VETKSRSGGFMLSKIKMSKVDWYLFKLPFIVLIAVFLFTGDLLSQALHDTPITL
jgi:hypothetical protein